MQLLERGGSSQYQEDHVEEYPEEASILKANILIVTDS